MSSRGGARATLDRKSSPWRVDLVGGYDDGMEANPYEAPEHYSERQKKAWNPRSSYIHQRFGPVVAKWCIRANCVGLLAMLIVMFITSAYLLASGVPMGIVPWLGAVLSFVGMVVLWRMYKSGIAALANDFEG